MANPWREFFWICLAEIRNTIEAMGMEAFCAMAAAAPEYHEGLAIE